MIFQHCLPCRVFRGFTWIVDPGVITSVMMIISG